MHNIVHMKIKPSCLKSDMIYGILLIMNFNEAEQDGKVLMGSFKF